MPWVFVGAWIAYGAALQRSVHGNRPWVVLVLTLAAALLAGLVAANAAVRLRRIHVPGGGRRQSGGDAYSTAPTSIR